MAVSLRQPVLQSTAGSNDCPRKKTSLKSQLWLLKGAVNIYVYVMTVAAGKGMWKLPTGLTSLGEDIRLAAEREVMEETGIRASFDRVICVRQSHGHLWNRDDLFFVCGMRQEPHHS